MFAVLLCVTNLMAHDTWLLASAPSVEIGKSVQLDLTSGELFPVDDFAIEPGRVVRSTVRIGGATIALPAGRLASRSLRFVWTPTANGIASVAIELAPKTLTLAQDKIAEYLAEIDAGADIRNEWRALGGKRQWIERYSKHATAYVRVGEPRGDLSWAQPMGLGLEIVPERDPTALTVRDTFFVRILRGGKPMPRFAVGIVHEGDSIPRFAKTDAEGRARIVFGLAGRWLLNGTDLRESVKPGLTWESDFVTTTLYVRK